LHFNSRIPSHCWIKYRFHRSILYLE